MILLVAKNGKPVVVHLNTDALAALNVFRSRGDGSGLVVRNAAGEALNVKRALVAVVRAAKIPDFRRHDVPHTFASPSRQKGVSIEYVAQLLGHSRKTGLAMTTLHYAKKP